MRRATLRTRLAAAVLLALAALAGGGLWLAWPSTAWARAQELATAERRWSLRPFGAYHLDLMDKACKQQILVRAERVVWAAPNRCEIPPRSVADLFDFIRRDGTVSRACILHGCVCDDVIRIQASYDQELGYPARIVVRVRAEPNWRSRDFWEALWAAKKVPSCSAMMEGSKVIRVLQIAPAR